MSTTTQKKFYTNYSFTVRARAKGYYDYKGLYTANSNTSISVNQQVYDGATLTYQDPNESSATFVNVINKLPDYTKYYGDSTFCLMPEGKNYKNVLLPSLNPYLINEGIQIIDGVAQDFSEQNFLQIDRRVTNLNVESTIKCKFDVVNTHSAVLSCDSSNESYAGLRNNGKFAFYRSGWYEGVSEVLTDTWYYLKIRIEDGHTKLYSLLAKNFTYDNLPDLSTWTLEVDYSGYIFDLNKRMYLGHNPITKSEYLHGQIDINNTKIFINNELFWEYPQTVYFKYNLGGSLHNYIDNGSASNLDCYCLVKNDTLEQKLILTQDNSVNVDGYESMYVGTVSIPAHDTYSYIEQSGPSFESVRLIGDVQLDTNTGVLSSFSINNYAELPVVFNPGNNPWEFQIKFLRTSYGDSGERLFALGGAQDLRGVTLWPNSNVSNWFISSGNNSWDISSGTQGSYNLELNTVYYCKVQFTGSAYICSFSTDGTTWEEDARFENSTPISNITLPVVLGTADTPSNETFNGDIYLDGCYLKIGDEVVWSGLFTKTNGVWTKQNNS